MLTNRKQQDKEVNKYILKIKQNGKLFGLLFVLQ